MTAKPLKPVPFAEQTHVMHPGTQNEVPYFRDPSRISTTICLQLTEEDLAEIKTNGGKIYLTNYQGSPIVTTKKPFREQTEEEMKRPEGMTRQQERKLKRQEAKEVKKGNLKIVK